jgi:hypothetical protein
MVDRDRVDKVEAAIADLAGAEGTPVAIRHVCQACASALNAIGVSLYVVGDLGLGEPVCVTDPVSGEVAELQVTLGEGPASLALQDGGPVLVADLHGASAMRRWPLFTPGAVAAGVLSVFAFPLAMGAVSVGALEVYRASVGRLSAAEMADVLLFADAAMMLVLDQHSRELFADEFGNRWAGVHQATGMVSAQLDSDLTEAFLRLRAHAFSTGCRLSDVADDVVEGRLRFGREA